MNLMSRSPSCTDCFAAFDGPLPPGLAALVRHSDPQCAQIARLVAEERGLAEWSARLRMAIVRRRRGLSDPSKCPILARMAADLASMRGRAIFLLGAVADMSDMAAAVSSNGMRQRNRRFVKGISGDRERA